MTSFILTRQEVNYETLAEVTVNRDDLHEALELMQIEDLRHYFAAYSLYESNLWWYEGLMGEGGGK